MGWQTESKLSTHRQRTAAGVAALLLASGACRADGGDWTRFSSRGLPGSEGVVVQVDHPRSWRDVAVDDPGALAERRGPEGELTGILQVGRGQPQEDLASQCGPERAATMLQQLSPDEAGTRVTDVVARRYQGRPAYEIRYERGTAAPFLLVRSLVVCLRDTRVVVSCGAAGQTRPALAAIEPVCRRVLDSVGLTED